MLDFLNISHLFSVSPRFLKLLSFSVSNLGSTGCPSTLLGVSSASELGLAKTQNSETGSSMAGTLSALQKTGEKDPRHKGGKLSAGRMDGISLGLEN